MTDSSVEAVARAAQHVRETADELSGAQCDARSNWRADWRVEALSEQLEKAWQDLDAAIAALPSPEREPRWFQDEEMRRHSDELREPMRWQPIETAPKDGTEILILAHGMTIQARYCPGGWSEDTPVNPAEYSGAIWCAFDDAVQFEIEETSEGDFHGPATHWMPLPAPPTAQSGDRA